MYSISSFKQPEPQVSLRKKPSSMVWYATYDFNMQNQTPSSQVEYCTLQGLKLKFDKAGNPCVEQKPNSKIIVQMHKVEKSSMVQIANHRNMK